MADYQIMTDATADLSAELVNALSIKVIPMLVDIEGESYSFAPQDSDISIEEFYRRLESGEVARTSQINAKVYRQYFEAELKEGRDVLYISLSSGLSGSIGVALVTAEQLAAEYPQRRVICIDSLCASSGEGLLTYTAQKKKEQGYSLEELAQWLEDNKRNMAHWFTVDELGYLQRGGRISAAAATVGSMLNIKPILWVNSEGKLISVNKVRGRKKSLDYLAEALKAYRTDGPDDPVFIGYGTNIEDALYLQEKVKENGGPQNIVLLPTGPVIGAHTGPSIITIFFFGNKK